MGRYSLERSLEIKAPVERIWDELLDVRSWPGWKPFISKVRFDGDKLKIGVKFTMNIAVKGPAVPVTCKVCGFDEHRSIAWTGGIPGVTVSVHSFIFEPGGSKTLVTSREEFTGALVGLMLKIVKEKDLFSLHDNWLEAVRKRMESK